MPASFSPYVGIDYKKKKNKFIDKINKRISPAGIKYYRELKKTIYAISKKEDWDVQIVLSTSWGWDKAFAERLISRKKANINIYENETYMELCKKLMEGSITLSTKMHPLIISASYGIPAIGISYNYKVDDFMVLIGSSDSCFRIDDITATRVLKKIEDKICERNFEIDKLKDMVYSTFEILSQL